MSDADPAPRPARGPAWAEYALYQAGWFAMVLGAASGRPGPGAGIATALLAAHLLVIVPRGERRAEGALIAVAAVAGLLLDTVQVRFGALRFDAGILLDGWAPPWIALLWGPFAATFRGCLARLAGRPALSAALGFLGGPAAYFAGARLGAVELGAPDPGGMTAVAALVSIGVVWAAALPALLALGGALERALIQAPPERQPSSRSRARNVSRSSGP